MKDSYEKAMVIMQSEFDSKSVYEKFEKNKFQNRDRHNGFMGI